MTRRTLGGVPPALLLAMALSVGSFLVLDVLQTWLLSHLGDRGWFFDWVGQSLGPLWLGLGTAASALAVAGFLDLARRVPSRAARWLWLGVAGLSVLFVLPLATIYVEYWDRIESGDGWMTYFRWRARVACAAAVVTSVAVIAAGWRHRRVRVLAAPLLVLTLAVFPTAWIWKLLHLTDDYRSGGTLLWLQVGLERGLHAAFAAVLLLVADAIGGDGPSRADWHRAGAGLHRVGSALVARVIIAVGGALLTVMLIGARASFAPTLLLAVIPAALLIAMIALITGVLQAGGIAAEGAPRLRLYGAAALFTATTLIQIVQAVALYRAATHDTFESDHLRRIGLSLPYLVPAAGLTALLLTLWAAAALRPAVADTARVDEGSITSAAVLASACTIGVVLLQRWMASGGATREVFFVATLAIAAATLIGQLAVARVCHRIGAAMQEKSELPAASIAQG